MEDRGVYKVKVPHDRYRMVTAKRKQDRQDLRLRYNHRKQRTKWVEWQRFKERHRT